MNYQTCNDSPNPQSRAQFSARFIDQCFLFAAFYSINQSKCYKHVNLNQVKEESRDLSDVLTSHRSSVVWAVGHQKTSLRHRRRPPPPGSGPNTPSADQKTRSCCRTSAAGSLLYSETSHPQSPDGQHENSNRAASDLCQTENRIQSLWKRLKD